MPVLMSKKDFGLIKDKVTLSIAEGMVSVAIGLRENLKDGGIRVRPIGSFMLPEIK